MKILYEDEDIIVVNKESGLPVQAGSPSQTDLISILKNHLCEEQKQGGQHLNESRKEPYLGIVHRLDQPVEGLVVFAKNPKAAGELSRQVQAKSAGTPGAKGYKRGPKAQVQQKQLQESQPACSEMRKVYQAVVLLPDKAALEKARKAEHSVTILQNYLKRNYAKNTTEIVRGESKDAKWAELTYRTLRIWTADDGETDASKAPGGVGRALLEIHLHTGRHHQIRVQLAGAGLPIDGDRKYGPMGIFYDYNLKLCAASLQFRHPSTRRKMQFTVTPSFLPELDPLFQEDPDDILRDPPVGFSDDKL